MVIKVLLLYCMVFCHIVDDYYLQGVLASMKQRDWWLKNAPERQYRKDYIIALIMHGFSWAFMVNVPLVAFGLLTNNESVILRCLMYIPVHAIVHSYIDNKKANKRTINLIQDQVLHMIQIILIWIGVLGIH